MTALTQAENAEAVAAMSCPICLSMLCEPMMLPCCQQSFCSGCLKAALATSSNCPLCRAPAKLSKALPNRGLEGLLNCARSHSSSALSALADQIDDDSPTQQCPAKKQAPASLPATPSYESRSRASPPLSAGVPRSAGRESCQLYSRTASPYHAYTPHVPSPLGRSAHPRDSRRRSRRGERRSQLQLELAREMDPGLLSHMSVWLSKNRRDARCYTFITCICSLLFFLKLQGATLQREAAVQLSLSRHASRTQFGGQFGGLSSRDASLRELAEVNESPLSAPHLSAPHLNPFPDNEIVPLVLLFALVASSAISLLRWYWTFTSSATRHRARLADPSYASAV